VSNRALKLAPGFMAPELQSPPSLVVVWGRWPLVLVQRTTSPR
jgi:hypothetical protein